MKLDLTDPVVERFISRLLTLTPSQWEAIDARLDAICDALPPPTPAQLTPWARLVGASVVVPLAIFHPSPEALRSFLSSVGDLSSRALLRYLGPAWQRQGAGPVRHLVEVLSRGYIPGQVRALVVFVLWAMTFRSHPGMGHELRDAYAAFEPVIPWASLQPPLLARSSSD